LKIGVKKNQKIKRCSEKTRNKSSGGCVLGKGAGEAGRKKGIHRGKDQEGFHGGNTAAGKRGEKQRKGLNRGKSIRGKRRTLAWVWQSRSVKKTGTTGNGVASGGGG